MAKKRVYELAKDLGLSNKDMVDWLRSHEYDIKSHSSSLEDDQAQAVTEKLEDPSQLRKTRKDIARMQTVLRQRALESQENEAK